MSWLMQAWNGRFQTLTLTGWVMKFVMFRVATDHAQLTLHHALDCLPCQVLWRAFWQRRPFTPLLSCLCLTILITSLNSWLITTRLLSVLALGGQNTHPACSLGNNVRAGMRWHGVLHTSDSRGKSFTVLIVKGNSVQANPVEGTRCMISAFRILFHCLHVCWHLCDFCMLMICLNVL